MRDAGNLLTRSGFTLPSVDVDEYTVRYKSGEQMLCSVVIFENFDIIITNVVFCLSFHEFIFRFGVAMELIEHLRAMGETNALLQRNKVNSFL